MKNPITAFIDKKLQKFDPLWPPLPFSACAAATMTRPA